MDEDYALKEAPGITECYKKVSCEMLKRFESFTISGEGLLYYHPDPEKKDVFGDRLLVRKDIVVFGSRGSGQYTGTFHDTWAAMGPFVCEVTGHSMVTVNDVSTLSLDAKFDFALLEGYEGPLYAQVVGPWPASKAVQVAEVMTEEKRIAHAAEQTHRKFLNQLKMAFGQIDSNNDGYVTRDEVEKALGGSENAQEMRKMMANAEDKMQAVAWTFMYAGQPCNSMDGVPSEADVRKVQALLALEADAKLSLDELRSMS